MTVMTVWKPVADELALWGDDLTPARLWLRDDDAIEPTSELEILANLSARYQVPVTIAVIPQPAQQSLAKLIGQHELISVGVHGYCHLNHAPPGDKKCELGLHRGRQIIIDELAGGRAKLKDMFGAQFINMLVPPWNRIDPELVPELADLGYKSLSTFTWKDFPSAPPLVQLNTHVDIIDWKGNRGGRAANELVRELVRALEIARQSGGAPVGILSHHLVHDEAAWDFLEQLFKFCANRHDIQWSHVTDLAGSGIL